MDSGFVFSDLELVENYIKIAILWQKLSGSIFEVENQSRVRKIVQKLKSIFSLPRGS